MNTPPTPEAAKPEPYTVAMPPEVARLAADYLAANDAIKAWTATKADLASELKLAAEQAGAAAPEGTEGVVFTGADALVSTSVVHGWRLDTARLKKDAPALYVEYAKQMTTYPLNVKAVGS